MATRYSFYFPVVSAADMKRKVDAFKELTGEEPEIRIEGSYTDEDNWNSYDCNYSDSHFQVTSIRGKKITVNGMREGFRKVMTFNPEYRQGSYGRFEFSLRSREN